MLGSKMVLKPSLKLLVLSFKYSWRVRIRNSNIHTHAVLLPLDTFSSSLKVKESGNTRPYVPGSMWESVRECALVHACTGESVPAALDASNTQHNSSENHYTEVTAETSPSASVLQRELTLSVSHTHTLTFLNKLIALRATNYANKRTKIETQPQHGALWDSKVGDWIIKSPDVGIWVNNTNR